jgi:hypothetical protein
MPTNMNDIANAINSIYGENYIETIQHAINHLYGMTELTWDRPESSALVYPSVGEPGPIKFDEEWI